MARLNAFAITLAATTVTAFNHTCPCDDPSLCRPLSPQPTAKDEVFAFTGLYGFARQPPFWNYTGFEWKHFDMDKITSIVPFDSIAGSNFQQYFCAAKKAKKRVLNWAASSWSGTNCGVATFYSWARDGDARRYNKTAVNAWARDTSECLATEGFDGISLDMEGIGRGKGPDKDNPAIVDAITYAVCQLRSELNRTIPGNLAAWTTDVGNYFDYKAMTDRGCIDIWLDMAYSWCVTEEYHSLTRNRANAPLPFVSGPGSIVDTYTRKFGVPVERLGIVFPWYGCSFKCSGGGGGASADEGSGPYHGCPSTPKFDRFPVYASMGAFRKNATSGVYMNASVATKYFNYRGDDGGLSQVWYDDPETLTIKYAAAKAAGVRGLGMWTADSAGDSGGLPEAMWAAVPTPASRDM
jgi:hypothetical protein